MAPPTHNRTNNTENGPIEGNDAGSEKNTTASQHSEALSALAAQLVNLLEMGTNAGREGGTTKEGQEFSESRFSFKKFHNEKHDHVDLVAHTSLKALDSCLWYLDSACSKHMLGDKFMFNSLNEYRGGSVTFGDGNHAQIKGMGSIEIRGIPEICEVLYVKNLKANLLSINQKCDEDCIVQFSKECNVFDDDGKWIMGGVRTSDNCNGIGPTTSLSCKHAKLDIEKLWHQRLGHLNFKDLYKAPMDELMSDLPKLGKLERMVCGPC
ncbi:uncharacterized protein LOC132174272 [Corylus avellana]|uniref:uncharacterized protein LOC132174272 n=1 Tax=Corylus avellana TaxID=13451 RepID=UPI00286CAC43|nr:uncharacterized protein LOC132174272 [Corylus avellana]